MFRFHGILDGLQVNRDRMMKNLRLDKGLLASQRILLLLVRQGADRERAHGWGQEATRLCREQGIEFQKVLEDHKEIAKRLTPERLREAFDLRSYLTGTDRIFQRVFQEG